MDDSRRATRRRHDAELKSRVLAECARAGASVAQIALTHGLNANLVHKWRRGSRGNGEVAGTASHDSGEFIALSLPVPSTPGLVSDIRIELRRGPTSVTMTWPVAAAADCAAWLRELLR